MSQKSGKKLRKRPDDEVETPTKVPAIEINKTLDEITVGNGVEKESEADTKEQMDDVEINGKNENGLKNVNEPEALEKTDDIQNEVAVHQEEPKKQSIVDKEHTLDQEQTQVVTTEDTKDEEGVIARPEVSENKICKPDDQTESKVDGENELEPLVLETEEVDPELEFEENSDIDSQKSSPIIRCTTRRAQTKNIVTPKTPKKMNSNNDDKVSEYSDKPSVLTLPTPEVTDTESEISEFKPITDVYHTNDELLTKTMEDRDSLQNISTKAIVGGDTTRNVEFSLVGEFELSPFLTESREKSVGETMKLLSSRRSIRSVKGFSLQSNIKKDYKTLPVFPRRDHVEKVSGTKRKHDDSPDYTKRFKPEAPGLLSYFSSPIVNIKNRFTKSEIPSSTPKLTGYKSKHVFDNTNMSKITLNETEDIVEKKWCTIM